MLFSVFEIDTSILAVSIPSVLEITRLGKLHKVRGAENSVSGLTNLRGKIVTILDGGLIMNLRQAQITTQSRIIIFKNKAELGANLKIEDNLVIPNENIGIVVDKIRQVMNVEEDKIDNVPANLKSPFIDQVFSFESDYISVVDPFKLINQLSRKEK